MNPNEFVFPKNYTSFKNGVDLSDEDINRYVKMAFEELKKQIAAGVKNPAINISTGNTLVAVFAFLEDGEDENKNTYTVMVHVTKDYSSKMLTGVDLTE